MRCSNCYSILSTSSVKHPVDTTIIHTCSPCGGVWVGGTSLKRLLSTEPSAPTFEKLVKNIQQKQQLSEDRLCPNCEDTKLFVLKTRGVEIDFCGNCNGVFFDKDELQSLIPELEKEGYQFGAGTAFTLEGLMWILLGIFG